MRNALTACSLSVGKLGVLCYCPVAYDATMKGYGDTLTAELLALDGDARPHQLAPGFPLISNRAESQA